MADKPRLRVIQGGKGKPKKLPLKQRLHTTASMLLRLIEDGSMQGYAIAGVTDDGNTVAMVCTGDANPHLIRASIVQCEDIVRDMMGGGDEVSLDRATEVRDLIAAALELGDDTSHETEPPPPAGVTG